MLTIGKAKKYFTLWNVSEPVTYEENGYQITEQSFIYMKNLSMDLEKAKEKLADKTYRIDLGLCGTSSYKKQLSRERIPHPEGSFQFGKYEGRKFAEVLSEAMEAKAEANPARVKQLFDDALHEVFKTVEQMQENRDSEAFKKVELSDEVKYCMWYYTSTEDKVLGKMLVDLGVYVDFNGKLVTPEEAKQWKQRLFIQSLESGHFFKNGSIQELELKEVDRFSFNGNFGNTNVISYATKDGKLVKYMGGSSWDRIPTDKFVTIKAVIKNTNYRDQDETRINRITILK